MDTSDGICEEDWAVIVKHAEEVVNCTGLDLDSSLVKKRLIRALDKLEIKYGRIPTILSTKADYVDNKSMKISLLKEAYLSACEISDFKNRVFISSTMSEFYLEASDLLRTRYWLDRLKEDLEGYPDEYFKGIYLEILGKL